MEDNRINSRRYRGRRNESYQSHSQSSNSAPSLSSDSQGRKCVCGVCTILMIAKKGIHAGRQFWKCPFWMRCQLHVKCLFELVK
ncbi:hypothetical protein QL285_099034 [Trifolium repens]|nr:hypothetical protein QL285_099034 [Trifolium repens]